MSEQEYRQCYPPILTTGSSYFIFPTLKGLSVIIIGDVQASRVRQLRKYCTNRRGEGSIINQSPLFFLLIFENQICPSSYVIASNARLIFLFVQKKKFEAGETVCLL